MENSGGVIKDRKRMFRSDYNADKNLKGKTNACQSEGNVLFCGKNDYPPGN